MVNAARLNADTTLNARYAAIKPLATVSQYTRAVRILNYDEREKLKAACREFDAAYGTCFPEKEYMTPKAAVIVILVPLYVEMYHTLGIFSEEAMESLHPQDNKFRVRVRSVQRPEDRHRALMTFHRLTNLLSIDVELLPNEIKSWWVITTFESNGLELREHTIFLYLVRKQESKI